MGFLFRQTINPITAIITRRSLAEYHPPAGAAVCATAAAGSLAGALRERETEKEKMDALKYLYLL